MSATTQAELDALKAADQAQYLTFLLGGETFGIGILGIKEIIEFDKLTTIPMMPGYLRGVINLRGAVVPVIDLAARFGGAASVASKRTCIVIVEIATDDDRQVVGVLVDAVNEVLDIAPADIEPAPALMVRGHNDFIAGMGKVKGNFVIILKLERLASVEDVSALVDGSAGIGIEAIPGKEEAPTYVAVQSA